MAICDARSPSGPGTSAGSRPLLATVVPGDAVTIDEKP